MTMTVKELTVRLMEMYGPDTKVAWQTYSREQVAENFGVSAEEITDEDFEMLHDWLGLWDQTTGGDSLDLLRYYH